METWLLVKFLSPVQTHKHLQEIICAAVDIISSAVQMSPFLQHTLTGCISHFSCKLLTPVVRFQVFASRFVLQSKVCMLLAGLAVLVALRSSLLFGED